MIDFIVGEITDIFDNDVVILNNNVGYSVKMPLRDINELKIGNTEKIYTRMIVREDDISLYGFFDSDTRILFDLLTSVSGIGPKVGIGILSSLNNSDIRASIISDDAKVLTSAPGVGKKTAERIILELKDKISKFEFKDNIKIESVSLDNSNDDDSAIEALVTLGYNKYEAKDALKNIDKSLDISKRIKEALKLLGR